MEIHKYKSYRSYKKEQIKGNREKLETVWTSRDEMQAIADFAKQNIPDPSFAICHGAKKGIEVQQLREFLPIKIVGTDLSPTAKGFPDMIQWDFNKPNPKWSGKTDIIFSNSFDHSYSPETTLDVWMNTLNTTGICFIEWTEWHNNEADATDPYSATLEDYRALFQKSYKVIDELEISDHDNVAYPLPRIVFCIAKP